MKKFDMRKICLAASLALFAACGDDVTNDSVVKAKSYESKADLPECDDASSGLFATVPSKKEVYFCADSAWKSVRSEAASMVDNGKFICSTEELTNSSGYKVVCGGDSVGVVLNGKQGEKGANADDGDKGKQGESGADASGSNGKDLTLGENDCAVINSGYDFVIYDCGDSVYVKSFTAADKADLKTWNAMRVGTTVTNLSGTSLSSTIRTVYFSAGESSTDAKLVRWDGDTWSGALVTDVTTTELKKNLAIRGKASLTVNKGATKWTEVPVEPMIGERISWNTPKDLKDWGGFCLTYEAKKDMELIISTGSPYKVARTTIKAAAKETTVDVPANAFIPDDAEVDLEDIIDKLSFTFVKAVGSLDAGKYENEFAIYEFGAYGKCTGFTISKVRAKAKELNTKKGTFKDPRDKKTYKTVTIGDQTWFAENLDYDYKVLVDPNDISAGYVEELVYEYPNQEDKAKYGGKLYTWLAAIDYDSLAKADPSIKCSNTAPCDPSPLPEKVQGICPEGWRLPGLKDYDNLMEVLVDPKEYPAVAELALQDSTTFTDGKGLDLLGLSISASGRFLPPSYDGQGSSFYTWLPEQATSDVSAGFYTFSYGASRSTHDSAVGASKTSARAIRCVKDNGED